MTAQSSLGTSGSSASLRLGRKTDSIPFSAYQVLIIFILALAGFVEGYDLFLTGSLLVLAKVPLHLTGTDIRWLFLGPSILGTIGGFGFSAVGERLSRKAMLVISVIATTFLTLLIPLVQNTEQLIIIRSLTALGAGGLIIGFTVVSAFPATRAHLSEQFPTALRGRGHIFGESVGKIVAGGLVPFFLAPHAHSPTIFFGTLLAIVALGAFVPVVWGKETVGQIEVIAAEPAVQLA